MSKLNIRLLVMVFMGLTVALTMLKGVGHAEDTPVAASATGVNVGGLAWIEPKSRVITLGAPNVMEGARIESLTVDEGDNVKKGQIIGFFSTYAKNKASLDVAEANLALAKADLVKVESDSRKRDISSQERIVESLKAAEIASIKEFKRIEDIFHQGLSSQSRYDAAKAEMDSATSKCKAAEETLKSMKQGLPDDIAIAKSRVQVSQSEVAVAKANVDLSTVIAPIDGTILTIYARSGEAVGDAGVLDIADLSVIDAVAEVDENDILKIKKGNKAEVEITGFDIPISGVVREIGGQIRRNALLDTQPSQRLDTRIVEVRIELDKSQNAMLGHLINKKVRARIFP